MRKVDTTGARLPAQLQEGARDSVGAAMYIGTQIGGSQGGVLASAAQDAFIDAMGPALIAAAVAGLVGALAVLRFMPARHLTEEEQGAALKAGASGRARD